MPKTKQNIDFFSGSIVRPMIFLSFPIFISSMLQFLYNVVDTVYISFIDKTSTAVLSGPGLVFPLFFVTMALGVGINTGVSSLVARGIGSKNQKIIDHSADSGLLLSGGVAIIVVVCGYLFGEVIVVGLAGKMMSKEAIAYGLEYFYYLLPGLGFMIVGQSLFGVLQGEGLTKKIAETMIIATIINVILDPIFIFYYHLGVKGAALATSVSICISLAYTVGIFLRSISIVPIKWNVFHSEVKLVREIVKTGFPQVVAMSMLAFFFLFFNKVVGSISQVAMNAWVICGRTDQILLMPAFAISSSFMTMLGQNYGKGNYLRLKEIYKVHIIGAIVVIGVLVVVYNLIARPLFSVFTDLNEVVNIAVMQVRFVGITFIGVGGTIVTATGFQAIGKPMPALVLTVIRIILISLPLAWGLVYVYGLGIIGVFFAYATGNMISLILSWVWMRNTLGKLSS